MQLIQDVATRRNSTYFMIERFLKLRGHVNEIVNRHKTAPPMLTGLEISICSSILPLLRPFEAATREVSGDHYTTSSKIIPLVHCLISKIKSVFVDEPVTKELQNLILREISKRMGKIEYVLPLAIATILYRQL